MEVRPWPSRAASQDLSKALPFVLGPLTVDPPMRRVARGERSEVLEPRVMRVLVALAGAGGKVLSRDDLIALCWDGQIVGDNAINRVISRLRAMLSELAGEAVSLETITKVGFRLIEAAACEDNHAVAPADREPDVGFLGAGKRVSRRTLIGGVAVLGAVAVAAGASAWIAATRHRPHPEALKLYNQAQATFKSANVGAVRQATSDLSRAVEIDPEYADAWGLLASMYRHGLDGFSAGERTSYPKLLRSAANRALALDPDQPDALLALVSQYPHYRRWAAQERDLRALHARFPDHWYVTARLGMILQDVGRFDAALRYSARVVEIDPMLPIAWAALARTYLNAGRFHESDATLGEGFSRFPGHPVLWISGYSNLLKTGRYREAAAFARDPRRLSEDMPPAFSQRYAALAEAMAADDANGKAAALAYLQETNAKDINFTPRAAPQMMMLGNNDGALDSFSAYLIGGKLGMSDIPAPSPLDTRITQDLLSEPLTGLRSDPRYSALLRQTGLEEYWRRSGSQPDFRRN